MHIHSSVKYETKPIDLLDQTNPDQRSIAGEVVRTLDERRRRSRLDALVLGRVPCRGHCTHNLTRPGDHHPIHVVERKREQLESFSVGTQEVRR